MALSKFRRHRLASQAIACALFGLFTARAFSVDPDRLFPYQMIMLVTLLVHLSHFQMNADDTDRKEREFYQNNFRNNADFYAGLWSLVVSIIFFGAFGDMVFLTARQAASLMMLVFVVSMLVANIYSEFFRRMSDVRQRYRSFNG